MHFEIFFRISACKCALFFRSRYIWLQLQYSENFHSKFIHLTNIEIYILSQFQCGIKPLNTQLTIVYIYIYISIYIIDR